MSSKASVAFQGIQAPTVVLRSAPAGQRCLAPRGRRFLELLPVRGNIGPRSTAVFIAETITQWKLRQEPLTRRKWQASMILTKARSVGREARWQH